MQKLDKENDSISITSSNLFESNLEKNSDDEEMIKNEYLKNEPSIPLLDKFLEEKGYTLKTYKFIFIAFLMICIEGLHMSFFSSMLIPLQKYLLISEKSLGIISSLSFLGVGFGSLLSGLITQNFGRTRAINFFLFLNALSSLLCGVFNNYVIFAILRSVIGFSLGLIVPVTLSLLTECLPIKYRSLILTSIWLAFGIGGVYLLLLILFFMPNYEVNQVQSVLFLSSILPIISFIILILILEDSVRNYIITEKSDIAFQILEKDYGIKLTSENKKTIEYQLKHCSNSGDTGNLFTNLFRGQLLILTILLSLIWFIDSFVGYGTGIITSLTLKYLGVVETEQNKQIIKNQIYINLISSIGNIMGGLLSELQHLGRNKTIIISFFISAVFLSIIPSFSKHYTLLFSITQFIWFIAMNVTTTYSCEVFPTSLRDKAIGFLFFMTRLGGFFSQYLFLIFNDLGIWVPYYISAALFFGLTFITFLMPIETYGRPLDLKIYNNTDYMTPKEEDDNDEEHKEFH
jgi:MFS family permease